MCVPISKLPQVLIETKQDLIESPLIGKYFRTFNTTHSLSLLPSLSIAPIIGHVGDGNFHCMFLLDPDNKQELSIAKHLANKMAK